MRGQAYEQIGEFQSAFSDYRQAESLFPMEEWRESARQAAVKLEPRLPPHARSALLKADLDSLEIREEIRRPAQEAFRFADLSPQLSISSARSALVALTKTLGVRNSNPRGALAPNHLEQGTKELEACGKISEVTAHEMDTIRILRNAVEYRHRKVTSYDAKACAHLLLAILKAVSATITESKRREP